MALVLVGVYNVKVLIIDPALRYQPDLGKKRMRLAGDGGHPIMSLKWFRLRK
jgi:hypothetical protein